jgi:hypothetical protein
MQTNEALLREASDYHTPPTRLQVLAQGGLPLARQVAQNPAAPSELLELLYQTEDTTLRENIAGNPNTPLPLYLKLIELFPAAALGNPSIDLFWLENPDFVDKISLELLLRLLRLRSLPVALLLLALVHRELKVRCLAVAHPELPLDNLWSAANDESDFVREGIAKNPAAPPELLQRLSSDASIAVQRAIVKHPQTPTEALDRFIHTEHRLDLAKHPKASVSALHELSTASDPLVRVAVARNVNSPAALLSRYLHDENEQVRYALLKRTAPPDEWLQLLAKDSSPETRGAVAAHPQTNIALLEALFDDSEELVWQDLARNPNLPEALQQKLLARGPMMPRILAANPGTTNTIRAQLAQDKSESLRKVVARNVTTPAEVLLLLTSDNTIEVRELLATHPNASAEVLQKLAHDPKIEIRELVPWHKNITRDSLEILAADKSAQVRAQVAQSPLTPEDLREKLSKDKSTVVKKAAKQRL